MSHGLRREPRREGPRGSPAMAFMRHAPRSQFRGDPRQPVTDFRARLAHTVDHGAQKHAPLLEVRVLITRIHELNGFGDSAPRSDQKRALLQRFPRNRLLRRFADLDASSREEDSRRRRDDRELAASVLDERIRARTPDVFTPGHTFTENETTPTSPSIRHRPVPRCLRPTDSASP